MSANTSLSRGRSLRIPTSNSLKPAPPSQPQIVTTGGPSNITLFLTNIRLLDFDLRSDWPEIDAVTFSTKDVQQNQKKRIQCVEWALYQLFALWDPDETRDKLNPFFPPLDHLQSLNLRAALFRCLDQVKKTGLLGRDAVLRKTMLDECKGERLEDILATFSTAVLRKIIRESNDGSWAPFTERLATESLSYTSDRTSLSTLIIAYKRSLSGILSTKKESAARFNDFADLLNLRERQSIRRQEELNVLIDGEPAEAMSHQEARTLQEKFKKNWTGSNDWIETILHGDNRSQKEDLLHIPFERVWNHVEDGSIGDLEYQGRQGLVEQLDSRIRQQSHRLAKWQSFEQTLANKKNTSSHRDKATDLERPVRGIDLGFSSHEALQLVRSPLKTAESLQKTSLRSYTKLIEDMRADLARVGTSRSSRVMSKPTMEPLDHNQNHTPILPDKLLNASPSPQHERHSESNSDTDAASHRSENDAKSISQTPPSEHIVDAEEALSPTQQTDAVADDNNHQLDESNGIPSPTRQISLYSNMPPPSPSSPSSPTASPLASEILASVLTTSPSPTKPRHVLSLAERTRLSVSRASLAKSSHQTEDSEDSLPELISNPLPQKLKRTSKSIVGHRHEAVDSMPTSEGKNFQEDLIARTRLSMSNFATVQKNAQIDRRRSIKAAARNKRESRSSYFPKSLEPAVEDEDLVLDGLDKKKLIEGEVEVDYDVVFKSRPRIKTSPETSPQRSPVKAWGEMGGRGDIAGSSSPMSEGY